LLEKLSSVCEKIGCARPILVPLYIPIPLKTAEEHALKGELRPHSGAIALERVSAHGNAGEKDDQRCNAGHPVNLARQALGTGRPDMRRLTLWAALGTILLAAALIPLTYNRLTLRVILKHGPEITLDASRGAR